MEFWGWVNEYIYIDRMELANNALPIYREGIEFKNMLMYEIKPTTECMQAYSRLSDCVLSKQLNVMDKEAIRKQCDVEQWRASCPGAIRRNHVEKLYRKSLNQRLYTQEQLDKYMEVKTHNKHWGLVDHRY